MLPDPQQPPCPPSSSPAESAPLGGDAAMLGAAPTAAPAPHVVVSPSVHSSDRHGAPILAIVVHATAGTNSLRWLTENPRQVSAHALIAKDGTIYRMVSDDRAAHHAGYSRLPLVEAARWGTNAVTLGVELENLNNGVDPYPEAQRGALGWLLRHWRAEHGPLPMYRHADIDTRGKTDPRGLSQDQIEALTRPVAYTADSPILAPWTGALDALALADVVYARCSAAGSPYAAERDDPIRRVIVPGYASLCAQGGVDLVVALAQMLHETKNLTSFWSQRPQRNPAGIGVNGRDMSRKPTASPHLWAFNPQRGRWEYGISFATWADDAIPAHVGRLIAYATRPAQRTAVQTTLARRALAYRGLATFCNGTATALRHLGKAHNPAGARGCGWAGATTAEGREYGRNIARVANELTEGL